MPVLSLRASISALSALSVAIVAAITLSITLTTSLAALRSIGKTHSTALLANAALQTATLFQRPAIAVETIKNHTMSHPWPWPSNDQHTFDRFTDATRTQFLACENYCAVNIFFADNTQMVCMPYDTDYYICGGVTVASYRNGGVAYQVTQPANANLTVFSYKDHTVAPASTPAWKARAPSNVLRATAFWNNSLLPATFNGYAATMPGLYATFVASTAVILLASVAPLYTLGSAKGPQNLYGFVVSTLRLEAIAGFLRGVGGTTNTASFAYDNLGFLLGASTPQPYQNSTVILDPSYVVPAGCSSTANQAGIGDANFANLTTVICRTHISAYGNAALAVLAADADFAFSGGKAVQLIHVDGDVYYAAVTPVTLPYPGTGVWLALVMPEADVIGDVVTGRNTAIGVTCGVFVLATVTTFAVIALLLRPLSTIADRMMLAASLDDDGSDGEKELSSMAEVEDLQQAYYAMNEELNRIKSFVPQTVLQKTRKQFATLGDPDLETDDLSAPASPLDETRSHTGSRSTRLGNRSLTDLAGALLCGLASQSVSVLAANLSGFEAAASTEARDVVVQGVADTVRFVHEATASQKGVVQSFHGDHFIVTYNAVTACAAHARRAAVTALHLVAGAGGVGLRLPFRVGVSTGRCLVGNLGSSEAKTFNTIGPAYVQAVALERMTRTYGTTCRILAPRRTCLDIATHVKFMYVDLAQLPQTKAPVLIGALTGEVEGFDGSSSACAADSEWLYTVNAQEDTDHTALNEVLIALAEGRTGDADQLIGKLHAPKPSATENDLTTVIRARVTAIRTAMREELPIGTQPPQF